MFGKYYDDACLIHEQYSQGDIDLPMAYNLGMLAKDKLICGHNYVGKSDHAFLAQWNGDQFAYSIWDEDAWSFEFVYYPVDQGLNMFVPMLDITDLIEKDIFGEIG